MAADHELEMIPPIEDESPGLVLRVRVPQHETVDDWCVLNAIIRCPAIREGSYVKLLGILCPFSARLSELNPRNILSDPLHVELYGSIAKSESVQGRTPGFQDEQSFMKALLT
jgi:hypothetical protein